MAKPTIRAEIEQILRNRTYDRHAADEEIFQELVTELDEMFFRRKGDF